MQKKRSKDQVIFWRKTTMFPPAPWQQTTKLNSVCCEFNISLSADLKLCVIILLRVVIQWRPPIVHHTLIPDGLHGINVPLLAWFISVFILSSFSRIEAFLAEILSSLSFSNLSSSCRHCLSGRSHSSVSLCHITHSYNTKYYTDWSQIKPPFYYTVT